MLFKGFVRSRTDERQSATRRTRLLLSKGVTFGMALCIGTLPTLAQLGPQTQNIPYGSPLSGNGQGNDQNGDNNNNSRRQQNTTAPEATSGDRIEPVTVAGSDRPTLQSLDSANPRLKPAPKPNEFEQFVETAAGKKLPRFGADLLLPGNRDYAVPATSTVPPDYVLNVGDIVSIFMTGSIEGSVDKEIDTNGRVFLPRVGAIRLAGVRYADLKDVVSGAIGRQYRGYQVSVGVRQLRGIRVYVTGFANNPGSYSVNSLSTMVNAVLAAGGPSAGGSFRSIQLFRNGRLVSDFDLYDLLLHGDRSRDTILQNEDVLFIRPVGQEVAVTGSVNTEAIFEAKPGETLEDALSNAGGPNTLADSSRVMLYRVSNFDTTGAQEIPRTAAASMPIERGDVLQILSQGTLQRPIAKQSVLVRVEGEVATPGSYFVPANTVLSDVLAKAGGLTSRAYVFGTRFERTSVKRQQRESFNEAIQQLEISLAAAPLTASGLGVSDPAAQIASARAVLERLRAAEPDGRVVLDMPSVSNTLPADFVLENNDRIVIPPRPTTIGVFGAVYRPASFAIDNSRQLRVSDYLKRAGGPLRAADNGSIFVVRANGEVISKRNGGLRAPVLPGDVVFVPVKTSSSSVWAKIRDITQIIFQLGLGAAAFVAVTQ